MDGAYQKKRLQEVGSTLMTVAVRPRHPTHMQDKEQGTSSYCCEVHWLKNSRGWGWGGDHDQPTATAKHLCHYSAFMLETVVHHLPPTVSLFVHNGLNREWRDSL